MKENFQDYTEGNIVLLSLAIITFIGGLFSALFLPNLVHLTLLYTGSSLYISTPFLANILFGVFSVLLAIAFFLASRADRKTIMASIPFFLAAAVIIPGWLTNYSALYVDKIIYNPITSLQSKAYEWSDVKEAVRERNTDTPPIERVNLLFHDGTELSYIVNPKFYEVAPVVYTLLSDNNIDVEILQTEETP
ncbi:hypothetical protein [Jeotgalibacillus proteolyticus]|uniref:Uncharacterized protein n=1 Tax=Jeotgalibacillus proteolyticus TaxID=2082395 RepID=A0A2S5GFP3_9BACL|nr:hypothetical protein [Jeotgalibacillus proteolyticus]PPA71731.1 hypothetical protein C4B60_06690 [Jeotgalibacillus proteolyticus]